MPQKSLGGGILVLLELGAGWPRSLVEGSADAPRRVLVELEGEGPTNFAERVAATAGSLFPRGVSLELAVLACNERTDERAVAARRSIARALFGRRSLPRLVISTSGAPREPLQRSLTSLLSELGRAERARTSVGVGASQAVNPATMSRVA